jgi:uncharacterized protein (TIGR02300 family)
MSRPELGTKRTDPETGRKFYDLGRDPIVSPYTGTSYPLSFFEQPAAAPSRRSAPADMPVHREEEQGEAAEEQDEDADTVSLADVEEDEREDGGSRTVDVDEDDDEEADKDGDDAFLALDEDEDDGNVDDLVGERDEEDH